MTLAWGGGLTRFEVLTRNENEVRCSRVCDGEQDGDPRAYTLGYWEDLCGTDGAVVEAARSADP